MSVVSIDESGAAESDDDDVVFLGNRVEAQPQQPPNEVVPVNVASDNGMDESDDESICWLPDGRRRRGGERELLRRQRAGGA